MREKIFNEILKTYPSRHDLNHKWELADKIFDIPVDGVQVKYTTGTTQFVCPLTIGEALEMLPNMVYLLSEKVNDPLYRDALTAIDGGIVVVKK